MPLEKWLYLPSNRLSLDEVVQSAQMAEDSGFMGIAFMDHLVTPYTPEIPTFEAMTLATWVAARTTTLKVGHLVLCNPLRHPAVLAKAAVTLDHASGGRFELGIGYGSVPDELIEFGITDADAPERAAMLVEAIATITSIWKDGRQQPTPLSRIPLVIGGVGPTTRRLAREYADWVNVSSNKFDRIEALRPRIGSARISVQLLVAPDRPGQAPGEPLAQARKLMPGRDDGLIGGSPEQVRDGLAGLEDRGVERVYMWPAPQIELDSIAAVCSLN